jgi:hypothetical protein
VFWQRIFRPVGNPQVFRSTAFDGGLSQATASAHDEIQRLNDHTFTVTPGQFFPLKSSFLHTRSLCRVDDLVWSGQEEAVRCSANLCERFHMPHVVSLDMDLAAPVSFSTGQKIRIDGRAVL